MLRSLVKDFNFTVTTAKSNCHLFCGISVKTVKCLKVGLNPFVHSRIFYLESLDLEGGSGYCPFDITRKDVFCLAFYFKWKYFVLNDHILSETICLFCFCVLFSNMYPKIKFIAKKLV